MAYPAQVETWYTSAPYPNRDDKQARFLAECLRIERGKDGPHKSAHRRQYREAQDLSTIYHPRANIAAHLNMSGQAKRGEVGFRPNDYTSARGHVAAARATRLDHRNAD